MGTRPLPRRSVRSSVGVIVALTIPSFAAPLIAQTGSVTFRHLTISDGLSQSAVYAIAQDRPGFMWIGTKDGLNRYDGDHFTIFRHDPADPTSLSDDDITVLFVDRGDRLWVGTRSGRLDRFDPRTERFAHYARLPRYPVTDIAEDREANLWIGTGGGLYRLPATGTDDPGAAFDRFLHAAGTPGSLPDDRVNALTVDRRGTLWVGTETGLGRVDDPAAETLAFRDYTGGPADAGGLADSTVGALLEDSKGRLWIGGVTGLSVLDPGRERVTHHYHRYGPRRRGWGRAVDLLEDRDGRIWMSTYAVLMRFDPATGAFEYFGPGRTDPASISGDSPTALFRDRSDVLWVGTNGYGLNLHDPKADRFHTFRRPEGKYRNPSFSVYSLFQDRTGTVWIGAGVLYRWNPATGAFRSFETSRDRPDDFGNTGVWSMIESPRGILWAGTYRGLYRYEAATGRYRQYAHGPGDPEGLPEAVVYDVFRDREGRLWVVTGNYLARLVDPESGRFESYRFHDPTVDTWTIGSLLEDEAGMLWLGSRQGLLRFDPRTKSFRRYRHDPGDPASLAQDVVRSLLLDPARPDRFLWVGTAGGGLNRLHLRTGTFDHYTQKDGLPNDVVYGILPDDRGDLWLSTNRGLSRFDPRTGRFRNYDDRDGLQSEEFNSGAAFRSASGELFFGGIEGFNHFRPGEIRDNPHVPPVVITGLKRGNRHESVRDSASVLREAISVTRRIRLSYRDDVVTLEFAALDYSMPSKNRYAYRLVGQSDEWIDAGGSHSATFTNLPPGRYTFQVRASNNDGVWNERGASLAIVVVPPWWRTRWAYAFYALVVLGGLWAARRYETGRILLKNRLALERVEADKVRELDRARSRFFANVSHEFRTPLTLTLGPLDDLRAGLHGPLPPAAAEQVDLARRNAGRVLDLINQMLDVARLEAGGTPLKARRLDLGDFVREVARSFAPLAERRELSFDAQVPSDPVEAWFDPGHMEKVVSNLLSNAMKFTPLGGSVRITVEGDEGTARVTVRDTGPGIPADERDRVFDRFHRIDRPSSEAQPGTGIGLALARELVELHGGTLEVDSEVGFGSAFTATLKRGRAHLADEQVVDPGGAEPWVARSPAAPAGPAPAGTAIDADAAPPADDGSAEDVTTVLLVEDNPEVMAYVRSHLEPAYRVLEATDGRRALETTRERLPDLVLSDVMMPGMDGYELCRAIKNDPETEFIPVVLLTARAATEDRLAGLEERADDFLTKPFDVKELLARIGNLIESRKRLRSRLENAVAPTLHPAEIDVEPEDQRFLERVREAVEENLGDETFTVERLAEAVGTSRGHLHRRLRALVDESPSEVLLRMRLERAAQLIEANAGSIGEIAYSVGFKSVSHFSNRFLDRFGVRPSAYRTEHAR